MQPRPKHRAGPLNPARRLPGTVRIVASVAAILTAFALLAAGCGVGFGAGEERGTARVLVSRDFGTEPLFELVDEPLRESDTVMRLLERGGEIETRYGGGFVHSINGLEGGSPGGRPHDWFFFVNGVEADRGSADYAPIDGDRIWWDFRDWGAAMRVPAVVGQFPEPFLNGYGGDPAPEVAVECRDGGEACAKVERALGEVGAALVEPGAVESPTRVLVGPWAAVIGEPAVTAIGAGPQAGGVYVRVERSGDGYELVALGADGEEAGRYGAGYGLVAATRRGESPPVWVVSGVDRAGVEAAAMALDEESLAGHFAVLVGPDGAEGLPVP